MIHMDDVTFDQLKAADTRYALAASRKFEQDWVCFAARASGLYRSDNGGETWQYCYVLLEMSVTLTTTAVVLSPDFSSDRTIFAGVKGGILRSTDGGQRWDAIRLHGPAPLISALAVFPCFAEDGMVWAGNVEVGRFWSTDLGLPLAT